MSSATWDDVPGVAYYVTVLRRRWITVLLTTLLCVGAAVYYTESQTPMYTASTKVLVTPLSADPASPLSGKPDATTEASVAKSIVVAQLVRKDMGLPDPPEALLGGLNVTFIPDSEVLELSYQTTVAEQAAAIVDSFAEQYLMYRNDVGNQILTSTQQALGNQRQQVQERLASIEKRIAATTDTAARAALVNDRNALLASLAAVQQRLDNVDWSLTGVVGGRVLGAATVPTSPSSPKPVRDITLGLIVGLLLGVGLAFLREHLDTRPRSRRIVEAETGQPVLVTVPSLPRPASLTQQGDTPEAAEAYRQLGTNLQFVSGRQKSLVLIVTSAESGEGKTTTAANLATVAAQAGQKVLVVSADLRSATIDGLFGVAPSTDGLSTYLAGFTGRPIVVETAVDGVDLLPSGAIPPNPGQLLTVDRFARVVDAVKEWYDLIIVDTPPVLPVADTLVLAPCGDAVVVIADAKKSRLPRLARAIQELGVVDANVVGVVLNRYDAEARHGYYGHSRQRPRRIRRPRGAVAVTDAHSPKAQSPHRKAE